MGANQRDTFSSRLHEQPSRAQLENHRIPNFKDRLGHLWQPLLALNRSQAITLSEVGLLDPSEASDILGLLNELEEQVDIDEFGAYDEFEGPYFFIENYLIQDLGEDIGGKLHTGRSRNDLYAAAFRIAVREQLLTVLAALLELREVVLKRAAETTDVVFPAFTHSQPAQPITFAHYLLAFDNLLKRDFDRLKKAFELTNQSPLGAAAIGGTGFPLDRERLAELSGFSDIVHNSYDAISSVDYLPHSTYNLAILMTNLSRVSQDFLVWSMFEVGFIELSEQLSSVSSIMPQKKNPGVIEKTRARADDAIGAANSSLVSLKAVPFGDVGETSYGAMPFLQNAESSVKTIRLFAAIIDDIELHEERMHRDAVESFCTMTELADTLVREGDLSFRQAHEVAGRLTHIVYNDGRNAGEITIEDLDQACEEMVGRTGLLTEKELNGALDPIQNVTRRDIVGGTAPERNKEDLAKQEERLADQQNWLEETYAQLDEARDKRRRTNLTT